MSPPASGGVGFLVVEAVPEIGAEPGDILVWKHPHVVLNRALPYGDQVTLYNLPPQEWASLFVRRASAFQPIEETSPRADCGGGRPALAVVR